MGTLLTTSILIVLCYKTLVFALSVFLKRNDIADVSWGISFILIAIVALLKNEGSNPTLVLLSLLITVWGLRLAIRIALRNRKKNEDSRYREMLAGSRKFFYLKSFLQVFILQGFLAILVSLPIIFVGVYGNNQNLGILVLLGFLIWLLGFFFEVVGDWQLDQFIANPENKGKIMTQGFWKYSRHPNYFGEITMWWGIFVIALSTPNSLGAIIGPLSITFLIVFISGIPLLEEKYTGNKDYETYKQQTSILIPLPPKT